MVYSCILIKSHVAIFDAWGNLRHYHLSQVVVRGNSVQRDWGVTNVAPLKDYLLKGCL